MLGRLSPLPLVVAGLLWAGSAGAQPVADPLSEAVGLAQRGEDRAAMQRLRRLPDVVASTARARYLRGRVAERLGEHGQAAQAFVIDGDSVPEAVAADARFRRAVALSRSGGCEQAMSMLEDFSAGSGSRASLSRAYAAECALALERVPSALEQLRSVAREDARDVDTFAVRLQLAEALSHAGQPTEAIAELQSLLVDRPEHPDGDLVLTQLEALGASASFDAEARLARAARFSEVRRHRDAIAELDAMGQPRQREALGRWLHLKGMALYGTRHHYAEAAALLGRSARMRTATEAEDAFHAARALSRADQDAQAVRAYRRFVRARPTHRRAAQAEYLAAWLEIRMGRPAGEAAMRRFSTGPRARRAPRYRRSAIWHLGFRAFQRGRYRDAAEHLERYASTGERAMVRGRGLYWLGRARSAMNERAAAVRAYREAIAVEPLHWYGLLSRQRLEALGEEVAEPFADAAVVERAEAPLVAPDLPADVAFYASLGLSHDAVRALRNAVPEVSSNAPPGRELEALVLAYQQLGHATRPQLLTLRRAASLLSERPSQSNRWAREAAYPRPYSAHVEPAARAQGLDPEYLWAIMWQESRFNPDAVSGADAIGLMQMLPATADAIASGLGVELRREMLFDPEWNVRLAATYNGRLYRSLGEAAPLSIAAFNAGAHRVRRWLEQTGDTELDLFVERIPIDQTRNYVRRVTSHYARYLYQRNPQGGWPLQLPERVRPVVSAE